jgi:hypothetical protein
MALIAHHPHGHDRNGDQSRPGALLRAFLTILVVTAVVAAALGAATYVLSRAFVGMLG